MMVKEKLNQCHIHHQLRDKNQLRNQHLQRKILNLLSRSLIYTLLLILQLLLICSKIRKQLISSNKEKLMLLLTQQCKLKKVLDHLLFKHKTLTSLQKELILKIQLLLILIYLQDKEQLINQLSILNSVSDKQVKLLTPLQISIVLVKFWVKEHSEK